MNNILLVLIIAVICIPFYLGAKKIVKMFTSKEEGCSCGNKDCKCPDSKCSKD